MKERLDLVQYLGGHAGHLLDQDRANLQQNDLISFRLPEPVKHQLAAMLAQGRNRKNRTVLAGRS